LASIVAASLSKFTQRLFVLKNLCLRATQARLTLAWCLNHKTFDDDGEEGCFGCSL
jgi:hypothetical protein